MIRRVVAVLSVAAALSLGVTPAALAQKASRSPRVTKLPRLTPRISLRIFIVATSVIPHGKVEPDSGLHPGAGTESIPSP